MRLNHLKFELCDKVFEFITSFNASFTALQLTDTIHANDKIKTIPNFILTDVNCQISE